MDFFCVCNEHDPTPFGHTATDGRLDEMEPTLAGAALSLEVYWAPTAVRTFVSCSAGFASDT